MTTLVSLNNILHKNMLIDINTVEAQGGKLHLTPVVLSEFLKLAVQFPIALTKNKETGKFVCVALFGFEPEENLYFSNENWDSIYIPLQISRQPFFLGNDENNQLILCIDSAHPSLHKNSGERLFDEDGKDSSYLSGLKSQLAELFNGEKETQEFVATLAELDLIQPMHLDITFADQSSTRVEGMYTINEAALQNLPDTRILELHKQGYLALIYTMLTSLGHIYAMVDRKNKRISAVS